MLDPLQGLAEQAFHEGMVQFAYFGVLGGDMAVGAVAHLDGGLLTLTQAHAEALGGHDVLNAYQPLRQGFVGNLVGVGGSQITGDSLQDRARLVDAVLLLDLGQDALREQVIGAWKQLVSGRGQSIDVARATDPPALDLRHNEIAFLEDAKMMAYRHRCQPEGVSQPIDSGLAVGLENLKNELARLLHDGILFSQTKL